MNFDYSKTYLYKLHNLSNVLDKAFDTVLAKHAGISFSQFNILMGIKQFEASNQRQLANFLQVTPAAVSRQLKECQKKGWIMSSVVKNNRRENRLSLSIKGEKVLSQSIESLERNLFQIFSDSNKSLDLSNHLDQLFSNTKKVLEKYKRSDDINNKEVTMSNVPKARQLFRGDINDAVIRVQRATGVNITPSWWNANVGNNGSTESILDRFDKAYEKFVEQQTRR